MTDKEIEELWKRLLNVKSFTEAALILKEAFEKEKKEVQ